MTRASSPVNNGKAKIALGDDTALTLSQKGRGNPFDPANYGEIVKPASWSILSSLSPPTPPIAQSSICWIPKPGDGTGKRRTGEQKAETQEPMRNQDDVLHFKKK